MIPEQALKDDASRFIFHSEIVSQFYLRKTLAQNSHFALRADRFLSWSAFRRASSTEGSAGLPADTALRTLFVKYFCAQDELADSFLDHPATFEKFLFSLLPHLNMLVEESHFDSFPYHATLRRAFEQYKAFLEEHRFFEENWLAPSVPDERSRTVFVMPELMNDFARYEKDLRGQGCEMISAERLLATQNSQNLQFHRYSYAQEEIRDTMLRIVELMDRGVSPDDIVITVAALERYRNELSATAARYGVTLRMTTPLAVSRYPGARIFSLLAAAIEHEFDCEALQTLFLDASIRWKEPALWRSVVVEGIAASCVRGSTSAAKDRWQTVLAGNALRRYKILRKAVEALPRQKSFAKLLEKVNAFLHSFLDLEACDHEHFHALSIALQYLRQLAHYECFLTIPIQQHWQVFLSTLEDCYLPLPLEEYRSVPPQKDPAILVHPYPLSAGIAPEYHFVLNCSHHDTTVVRHSLYDISPHHAALLDIEPQYLSDAFLESTLSSGVHLICSMSADSFGEPQFPCLALLHHETGSKSSVDDPYRDEERWWTQPKASPPPRVSPMQSASLSYMTHTGLSPFEGANFRRREAASLVHASQISATALDAYRAAPFSYYLDSLGLRDIFPAPAAEQARRIGSLMHKILSTCVDDIPETVEGIAECVSEALEAQQSSFDALSLIPHTTKQIFVRMLTRFLEAFHRHYPNREVISREQKIAANYENGSLSGVVDLVLSSEGSCCVVDYKLSRRFSKQEFRGDARIESLPALQLLIYTLFVQQDTPVQGAAYWHIKSADYLPLFAPEQRRRGSKPVFSEAESSALLDSLPQLVEQYLAALQRGDVRCPHPHRACAACRYRSVCRGGFSTE